MPDRTELDILKKDRGRLVAELEKAGATVSGTTSIRCPFHEDTNASGGIHELDCGGWAYTCHGCNWNDDKRSGDVFDVVRRALGCDFGQACEHLGLSNGKTPAPRQTTAPPAESAETVAADSHRRLIGDPDSLDHLWRTRGIDKATAIRFRVGITGSAGRRYWTFPVGTDRVIAVKKHAADGQPPKGLWLSNGAGRDHLWPVCLDGDGPVWICPGELKALAVIGIGLPAIGITSGEGAKGAPESLPDAALDLVRGLSVALPPDDDAPGEAWGAHVKKQLSDAGIDARIVALELDKSAGLKDVGDRITRGLVEDAKEPDAMAATLRDRYRRSDPWYGAQIGDLWRSGEMWQPATHVRTGLATLDRALGGGLRTLGTHLIVGKPGKSKTQLAVTIAIGAASNGIPTGFLSLELGRDDIAQLVAAQLGGIPRRALSLGQAGSECLEALDRVKTRYGERPLFILDDERWPHGLDRDGLSTLIGEGVARFGWRCVVVDYLGLLSAPRTDRSDFQTDLLNSAALRRMARKHDVALLVVAALRKSAGFKSASGEGITIDDVAGAGRIAYDAQTVLFVNSEHGESDTGFVQVRPLKLRFAPMADRADIQFRWTPSTGLITDLPNE